MGASDIQVGLIGAAYGGSYLISSIVCGRLSDKRGRLYFIRWGMFLSILAFAGQLLAHRLAMLVLARAGVGLALGITTAALVAYAFELKADMGRFSSYGSLGWIAGAMAAAWLSDIRILFIVSIVSCSLAFVLSRWLVWPSRKQPVEMKIPPASLRQVVRRGFPIYLAVFLRHLGAAAVWIIFPLYFVDQGLDRAWVDWLWSVNFAMQFIVMRYLERFEPRRVFAFGQILSIFVFVAYVFISNPWLLIAVQALLGVAWACLYVGALLLVLRTGEERGTASGIFHATLNLCSAVGPFLGGAIAQYWGYHGVMIFAALVGVAGMAVAVDAGGKRVNSAGERRN